MIEGKMMLLKRRKTKGKRYKFTTMNKEWINNNRYHINKEKGWGSVGGQAVSALAFYSDD